MDKTSSKITETKLSILIVGGDNTFREIMHSSLKRPGFRIFATRNSNEAMDKLNTERVHVVFLNIPPADLSGMDVLQYIERQRNNWGGFPYVITVSGGLGEHDNQIKELGVDAVIHKPISVRQVEKLIDDFHKRLLLTDDGFKIPLKGS